MNLHRCYQPFFIASILFLGAFGCGNNHNLSNTTTQTRADSVIQFNDDKIQYIGRVDTVSANAASLCWPGTQVVLKFKGTGLRVQMEDDSINTDKHRNHFYVFVDGKKSDEPLRLDDGKQQYTLCKNLKSGDHIVGLYKLNSMHPGYPRGGARLFNFTVLGHGESLAPPPLPTRKIEFYGNSITCGVSNAYYGEKTDDFRSRYENNFESYGSIVARHFGAQFSCIAKSGIGLLKGTTLPTMPDMYDLYAPFGNDRKWDFSKFQPQIVVINLLQNDATLISKASSDTVRNEYMDFVTQLRLKYPDAFIICALGSMNAVTKEKWRDIVASSVKELNDSKTFLYFFDYIGRRGHPRIEDHRKMAEGLIGFIERNKDIQW